MDMVSWTYSCLAKTTIKLVFPNTLHKRFSLMTAHDRTNKSCMFASGDELMLDDEQAGPEVNIRWPSPARSDSEHEAGPLRPGRKRHPKLRLIPKAVRRMNRKRGIKSDPAFKQQLPAAADGTLEGNVAHPKRNSASMRVRKALLPNKV